MHRMKKVGGGVSGPCLIPHQHQVGKAGQGLAKLVLAWLLPPRDPFSFGVISERQHVGWPGS